MPEARCRARRRHDPDRSSIMSMTSDPTTPATRPRIEADPDVPTVTHHPRVRRPGGAGVPGLHRAGPVPAVDRPAQPRPSSSTQFDCRTGGAWRYSTDGTGDFERSTGLPRGPARRADRADVHLRGLPGPASPWRPPTFEDLGDGRSRVTSVSLVDSLRGARRDSWPAAWRPVSSRATRSSTSCSRRSAERSVEALRDRSTTRAGMIGG